MKKRVFFFLCFFLLMSSYPVGGKTVENPHVVRLHILANSNEEIDQQLKLQLRDQLLEKFKNQIELESQQQFIQYIQGNIEEINHFSQRVMVEEGFNYLVQSQLTVEEFPEKTYGDLIYPKGQYLALKITIGRGQGDNWWCVLYPPLCHEIWIKEKNKGLQVKEEEEAILVSTKINEKKDDQYSLEKAEMKKFITTYLKLMKKIWVL